MQRFIDKVLRCYGASVILHRGSSAAQLRGFLQPVTARSQQQMERLWSGIGQVPKAQYLYIGPVKPMVQPDDLLEVAGKVYVVRRADALMAGDQALYCWGLCTPAGGDGIWTS